jgi:hypothetical protein
MIPRKGTMMGTRRRQGKTGVTELTSIEYTTSRRSGISRSIAKGNRDTRVTRAI